MQEDSSKMGKVTSAGAYFFSFPTYRVHESVNPLTLGDDPEAALFRKLDGFKSREESSLEPGEHVFVVYGDNWFKRGNYRIDAVRLRRDAGAVHELKALEAQIKDKQAELRTFETSYRAAKKAFQDAVAKFEGETKELAELLSRRDDAYANISSSLMYAEPIEAPERGASSSSSSARQPEAAADDAPAGQDRAPAAPADGRAGSRADPARKSWFLPRFK